MSAQATSGGTAVMARRKEAPDSLDFFPTPPWATRAFVEVVLPQIGASIDSATVWEPACGAGHISHVLRDYGAHVTESDVHDYGIGAQVGSYIGEGLDVMPSGRVDWVITNPPFNLAERFTERALNEARVGVALLLRTAWIESIDRYNYIFKTTPPSHVAQYVERVPMTRGRWDPQASSATAYAWFIWHKPSAGAGTHLVWIPPGQCDRLTKRDDVKRFAQQDAGTPQAKGLQD